MTYNAFLVSADDSKDGLKIGYAYAKANKDRWIKMKDPEGFITVGYNKGSDFLIHDDKAYQIVKSYFDMDEGSCLIVATECISGAEVKENF